MRKLIYCISIVIASCNSGGQDCLSKEFDFAGQQYYADGCLINEMETGAWSFYQDPKKLISRGIYERGIRIGEWHYPENSSDSTIEWKRYEKKNLELAFNIPTRLQVVSDTLNDAMFSNFDSSKLFNIILSVIPIEETDKQTENYYQQGEAEIKDKGWKFSRKSSKIITKNQEFYFNTYTITISAGQSFKVLNMYRLMADKKLLEISCRYDEQIEPSAKIVFFSVFTNSFYKNERFLNPFERIKGVASY